jgi:hypothetical protein
MVSVVAVTLLLAELVTGLSLTHARPLLRAAPPPRAAAAWCLADAGGDDAGGGGAVGGGGGGGGDGDGGDEDDGAWMPGDMRAALEAGRIGEAELANWKSVLANPLTKALAASTYVRCRLLAEPRLPAILAIEVGVGCLATLAAEKAARGDKFLAELDFVLANQVLIVLTNIALVLALTPAAPVAPPPVAGTLAASAAALPGFFLQAGDFTVVQRATCFVSKAVQFSVVGSLTSAVGQAVTKGLVTARTKLDPDTPPQVELAPVLPTAGTLRTMPTPSSCPTLQLICRRRSAYADAVAHICQRLSAALTLSCARCAVRVCHSRVRRLHGGLFQHALPDCELARGLLLARRAGRRRCPRRHQRRRAHSEQCVCAAPRVRTRMRAYAHARLQAAAPRHSVRFRSVASRELSARGVPRLPPVCGLGQLDLVGEGAPARRSQLSERIHPPPPADGAVSFASRLPQFRGLQ